MRLNMFKIYILKSERTNKHYIGQTDNLNGRLKKHNSGKVKSTKFGIPWTVIHFEECPTRDEAMKREKEIKNFKGGIKFKKLLGLWKDN